MQLFCLTILCATGFYATQAASIGQTAVDWSQCGAICNVYCPFGNVINEAGCPTCRCNPVPVIMPDPGATTLAPVVDIDSVAKSQCVPVYCRLYCPNGWAIDPATGCEYCGCKEIK